MDKKIKKRAFLVGAGVVLAYVAAPGFMAGSVETMVKESLNSDLSKQIPGLVLLEYDRGWFKSTATIGIKVPDARPQDLGKLGLKLLCGTDEVVFCFDVDVKHGPIVTSFGTPTLAVGQVQASWSVPFIPTSTRETAIAAQLLNPWALSATITAHFDETIDYEVSTSGVDIDLEEGGASIKIDADPIKLSGSYSIADAVVFSNFDMPKMHVQIEENGRDKVNVKIDNIHAKGEGTLIGHAFAYGTTNLTIGNIQVNGTDNGNAAKVDLQNFAVTSTISPDGDSISNLITMGLEKLQVQERLGNEEVNISSLNLEANLHGIDRVTYEDILVLANSFVPGQVARNQIIEITDHFHDLVRKGLNFDVNTFSVNVGEGKVAYNHTLNFPAGVDWQDHDAFEENAKLDGTFTFNQALVDFIEAHDNNKRDRGEDHGLDLAEALEEGLLVKEGDNYTAKFNLENGVGTVNGKNVDELKDKMKIRIKSKKDNEKEME